MNKCIDCNKKIHHQAIRCISCNAIYFSKSKMFKGKNNPNFKNWKSKHYCEDCGKLLNNYYAKRCKFCNNIRQRKSIIIKYCICGKQLFRYNYSGKCKSCGTKESYKLNKRKRLNYEGSKNPNWKNGFTPIYKKIRNNKLYKILIQEVLKRDNYTCGMCNKIGNKLHAHHKLLFSFIVKLYDIKTLKQAFICKLLWDKNWLVTLCDKCHQTIHPEYNVEIKVKS